MFITYIAEVENQLKKNKDSKIQSRQRYESNEFSGLCANFGIIHQTTAPYTPQQNGIIERKKQKFKRDDKFHARKFWCTSELMGEALLTANYILNRVSHKKLGLIPFEL